MTGGGRVLDTTAILDIAGRRTVYTSALLDTANALDMTLVYPAVALLEAWQQSTPDSRPFLELLSIMPTSVVDQLDEATAAAAGMLAADAGQPGARPGTVQAVHLARTRGWAVVTADVDAVLVLDPHVQFESLP